MNGTRNLCAQIPISLHAQVMEEKTSLEQSLSEYVTNILKEHFEGGKTMAAGTKTLAFQIPEELFQRLRAHLDAQQQRTGKQNTDFFHRAYLLPHYTMRSRSDIAL